MGEDELGGASEPDDRSTADVISTEEATEILESVPEEGTSDMGEITEELAAEDDVLSQLDESARDQDGLFKKGIVSLLAPPWRRFNQRMDERYGLRFGFTYFSLLQFTTPGPEQRRAGSGDADFFGRWTLRNKEKERVGIFAFNLEYRHAYFSIPPSRLNRPIGSIWRTTRGFTDSKFNFNELWWDHQVARDRVQYRIGLINQKHMWDLHKFKSQKRFYLSWPLSDSPTIAFPSNGLGANVRVTPFENVHVRLGIGDANGDRSLSGTGSFFTEGEYFTAAEVSFTPTVVGLGPGRYSATVWHRDARSSVGVASGRGFNILIQQKVGKRFYPLLRYGYGEGASLAVNQVATVGFTMEAPFGKKRDAAGVAASWGRPQRPGARDQWGMETFYRVQLSEVFSLGPNLQFIANPSLNPDDDFIAVVGVRMGMVF